MRILLGVIFSAILSMSVALGAESGKHLFILTGQSNMVGLKLEISFTPTIEAEFGKANVIIIKDASGGQPISRWYKKWRSGKGAKVQPARSGDLYDRLMVKVNAATEETKLKSVTFIWMQGESDAVKNGDVYADSLIGLIQQFKQDLQRNNLNVVIGRISDHQNVRFTKWDMVREAEVKVADADPLASWVDTDDLNGEINDLHYTKAGYKILGTRFAEAAIDLIKNRRPAILGEVEVKRCKAYAKSLSGNGSLAPILAKLDTLAEKEGKRKDEAKALAAAARAWVSTEQTRLTALAESEPANALNQIRVFIKRLKGMEELAAMQEILQPLQADKSTKALAKIRQDVGKVYRKVATKGASKKTEKSLRKLKKKLNKFAATDDLTETLKKEAEALSATL